MENDFQKENEIKKEKIKEITELYKSVGENSYKSCDFVYLDTIFMKAFAGRKMVAKEISKWKVPSKTSILNNGEIAIFERLYEDDDIEVSVKLRAVPFALVSKTFIPRVKNDPFFRGSLHYYLRYSIKAKALKTKEASEDNIFLDNIESPDDIKKTPLITFFTTKNLNDRKLQYYVNTVETSVARAKAKEMKKEQKTENLDPKKVKMKFINTANTVEKAVFDEIELKFKKVLIERHIDYFHTIKSTFEDAEKLKYPVKVKGFGTSKEVWVRDAHEYTMSKYGADVFLAYENEAKIRKYAEALAIGEIVRVLNDVKNEGGDITGIFKEIAIVQGTHLNAGFVTTKGKVNVVTFPAALWSEFMRPHLRTKVTLLKR